MLVIMNAEDQSSVSDEELKHNDNGDDLEDYREETANNEAKGNREGTAASLIASESILKTTQKKDPDTASGTATGSDDDDGEKEGANSSSLYRVDSGLLPFPEKLMALLDGNQVSDSMWWLPDGDSFCLIPVVFAEKVLDKHFQGTKFESFTRKLNRWGFKRVAGQKVPANTIAYYNKHFIRGQPKLLKNMNGGKTKMAASRESKREQTKLRRDRQQDQDVLIAAQQQAMYSDCLSYPGTSLFRPGLSSLLGGGGGHDLRTNQILAAEIMAQREREELQMRLAMTRGAGGYNSLLGGHAGINTMLAQQQALTPFEQQLLMARHSVGGYPDFSSLATTGFNPDTFKSMGVGAGGLDLSSGRGGISNNGNGGSSSSDHAGVGSSQQQHHQQQQQQQQHLQQQQQQNNLRSIAAAKAGGAPNNISSSSNNNQMDPQLLLYLQDEQRKKDMDMLKKLNGGAL